MLERQVIVSWYTPGERLPAEGEIVIVSMSGKIKKNITCDHSFALAEWWRDEGWYIYNVESQDDCTVHAWCDLDPYGGREAWRKYRNGDEG